MAAGAASIHRLPEPIEQQAADAGAESLCWRCHPLVDDYPRSVLLLAAIAAACIGAAVAFDGAGYGVIAGVLLCVSLGRYLLPTRFTLDGDGAEVRFMGQTQRMAWSQVRRVSRHPKGLFLSDRPTPSRLDSFRGLLLRFADNADEVTSFVEDKATISKAC